MELTRETELKHFFYIMGLLKAAQAAMDTETVDELTDDLETMADLAAPVVARRAARERECALAWLNDVAMESLTGEPRLVVSTRTGNVALFAPRPLS